MRFAVSSVLALVLAARGATAALPERPRDLAKTVSYAEMVELLKSVDGRGPVRVSAEATTAQGRSVFLVRLSSVPEGVEPAWKILFYAQQHGDEISGKDALLFLVRDVARDPSRLPPGVEAWVFPMMNPDGAEAGTRRNAAKADLNRDHMTLDQPETQALHRAFRKLRPHVAVDSHEFGRDPDEWRAKGLRKWPDITMDGLNNPLFSPDLVAAARRHVDEAGEAEARAGHPFQRYFVGGVPPDEEQRHSAPDVDGGLNALGAYGGLSFIIEAASYGPGRAPAGDLGNRVDAYLVLFRRFLEDPSFRARDLEAIARAKARPLPAFLATNALWVNPRAAVADFPAVEIATGRTVKVPTANLMTEIAVKASVPAPLGYAVLPPAAPAFRTLLERHGLAFETLAAPREVTAETATLKRVEEDFDEVYARYGGRTIVARHPAKAGTLPAGSLVVTLAGEDAVRAALLLEPCSLYGLWQYPAYRALVGKDGAVPVLRLVGGKQGP